MEALGLASVGDNKEALEQRLLQAVRDLALVRDEKDKLAERMVALIGNGRALHEDGHAARPARSASKSKRSCAPPTKRWTNRPPRTTGPPRRRGDLTNGQVVSVKEEYSLIVANLGSQQGVKIGMPFLIQRGNHLVARARVVDVRERISGAIIEEYGSNTEKVKVGDTMHVDVQS